MAEKRYTKNQKQLLADIENEIAGGLPFTYRVDNADLRALWADNQGPIEINEHDKDSDGRVPVRPRQTTPTGGTQTTMTETITEAPIEVKSATGLGFILDGVGMNLPSAFPAEVKGVRKPEFYPFSKLEIGDSFFIGATDKYPTPWVNVRSAVNAQNSKHSTDTGETKPSKNGKGKPRKVLTYAKKFEIRKVTEGDTYTNGFVEKQTGARVYRSI